MICAFNREQFRPLRLVHPIEPRFLSEDSEAEVTSKASQRAREQWAAAQACIQRREQQDRALVYLALKQTVAPFIAYGRTIHEWQSIVQLAELIESTVDIIRSGGEVNGHWIEKRGADDEDRQSRECMRLTTRHPPRVLYRVPPPSGVECAPEPVAKLSDWVPARKRLTITEEPAPVNALNDYAKEVTIANEFLTEKVETLRGALDMAHKRIGALERGNDLDRDRGWAMNQPTQERFLTEVANHRMTVLIDTATHRHLHFSDGTMNMHFMLTTWPGYLCISGDMGCFVFQRLKDMFCFFRGERINVSYWAEKIQAGSWREHSPEYARERVCELVADETIPADHDEYDHLDYDNPQDLIEHLMEAGYQDAWEESFMVPTYHNLWCLQAIVWGIQQYDQANNKPQGVA